MDKNKICFIVSTPYTAKAFLENHFNNFSKIYEVYLIANLDEEALSNYNHPKLKFVKHIKIVRKISLLNDIKALFVTFKYLKTNKFDVVICFTPKAGLIGITASKLARIKHRVIFFTGQVWHTKKGVFKFFLKLLDKWIVLLSSKVLVDGKPQQEYLIKNKIITKHNSVTLGKGTISGIDVIKFSPNINYRKNIREELGFLDTDFVFLFLGRLNVDKGVLDLVKAFVDLEKTNKNVKLLFVGPDEEEIEKKIKNLEYNSNAIFYYGETNNPDKIYPVAEVFCLPSHREAFGLSIIEASSCGLPIICSDTYGLKDSIIENATGLRHEVENVRQLYNQMKLLVEKEELRKKLGIVGRQYVLDNFSTDSISKEWLKYFKELLK